MAGEVKFGTQVPQDLGLCQLEGLHALIEEASIFIEFGPYIILDSQVFLQFSILQGMLINEGLIVEHELIKTQPSLRPKTIFDPLIDFKRLLMQKRL